MQAETDPQNAGRRSHGFDNLAGNVLHLVSETDENFNKIHERLNFSTASVEKRLLDLEEAVAELRDILKMPGFELKLSASDVELSNSGRNLGEDLSPAYDPVESRPSSSRGSDAGKPDVANLAQATSSLSGSSEVGKTNVANLLTVSSQAKKNVTGDVEVNAKLGQLSRKLKMQLKQDRVKMNEFESKLRDIADHVTKLRATVSCDEAEVKMNII